MPATIYEKMGQSNYFLASSLCPQIFLVPAIKSQDDETFLLVPAIESQDDDNGKNYDASLLCKPIKWPSPAGSSRSVLALSLRWLASLLR